MKKTLLIIQYYKGDAALARKMIDLIVDFQAGVSEEAGVMLATRFDTPADNQLVQKISRRFHVYTHTGRRRGVGWPAGPNDLWFDTMQYLHEMKQAGRLQEYDHAVCMEADDCPTSPDWITRLRAAWGAAQPCAVMGHIHEFAANQPHVNGNCVLSLEPAFLKRVAKVCGCGPDIGWDCVMAPLFFHLGAVNTPLIRNLYARPTLSRSEFLNLKATGCAMIHGVKDGTPLRWSREAAFDTSS